MLKKFVSDNLFWLGIILVFLYYLPFLIFGENSYITINDLLDSSIANIKTLIDNNAIFERKPLPIMEGISGKMSLNIKSLIYLIFPTFTAIIINDLLVRLCAYVGMFFLLKTFVLPKSKHSKTISFISSICFAFIPFYSDYMLSSAGIPLLVYAMLNLKENNRIIISFSIVAFFGFYSDFVLSGIFLCFTLFLYYLYIIISDKKVYLNYLIALSLLSLIYIFSNLDLFTSFFMSDTYVSHRVEFQTAISLESALLDSIELFIITQYHAGKLVTIPIILTLVLAFVYDRSILKVKILRLCILGVFLVSFIAFGINILKYTFNDFWLLNAFQFDRFYFFLPTLWIIIFAIALSFLIKYKQKLLVYGISILLLIINFCSNNEYLEFGKKLIGIEKEKPSFKQFYDTSLFDDVADSLKISERAECRVVSLGLYPSIPQYNGFYTLDAYYFDYPLSYKHKFRKVMEKELVKKERYREYYDDWGSRCYIFSSEIPVVSFEYNSMKSIGGLDIDINLLREMKCEYIFSAVEILNYSDLGLLNQGVFSNKDSFWSIYVYAIPVLYSDICFKEII